MEAHLAKRKRNPARIPPQTPPAGGNQPRQGESKTPEKLFRPAESFFRILNQDCFGKKFGFCSGDTAEFVFFASEAFHIVSMSNPANLHLSSTISAIL